MASQDFEIFDIFHFASRTVCVFHGKIVLTWPSNNYAKQLLLVDFKTQKNLLDSCRPQNLFLI